MRTIGVVSAARSDYGIYRPLLKRMAADRDVRLALFVSGSHLAPEFGLTVREIENDGYPIAARINMLLASDTPEAIAKSMGIGLLGFAQAFAQTRPDVLVVLGDRFDMYVAALAALPFKIPVAHIHGGELSFGAIDDALRHSMTKLSHLHFVSTGEYARRVRQMGEEPWRVSVCGAMSLENLQTLKLLAPGEIEARWPLRMPQPFLLVTFHPVTLQYEQAELQLDELFEALSAAKMQVVATLPNADTAGRNYIHRWRDFAAKNSWTQVVDNLGTHGYFSLMALAAAMVGNSSSGILESPAFKLPVVNIGLRQEGRVRAQNVVDVGASRGEILTGIQTAADPAFKARLGNLENPYYAKDSSATILQRLKTVQLDDTLLLKRFADLPAVEGR